MVLYDVKHQQNILKKYSSKSITVEIATCRFFFWLMSCVVKQHFVDIKVHIFRKCDYSNRCS